MKDDKLNGTSYCADVCYRQFQPNKEFAKLNTDNGFLRYRFKLSKPQSELKINQEVLATLLTSIQGDNVAIKTEFAENFTNHNVHYGDLASLTYKDLEILGIKNPKERNDLIKFFSQLPNQDASYDNICHLKEAVTYNNQIIMRVSKHFVLMRSIFDAVDYKLQIIPNRDVMIDEKSYANRFVLKAIDKLMHVTDDIHERLERTKFAAMDKQNNFHRTVKLKLNRNLFVVSHSICCVGILLAIYYWKWRN